MRFFTKLFAFVALLVILPLNISADGKLDKKLTNLVLQTKVLNIAARQNVPDTVEFELEVENTFTNRGDEPIIILQPYNEKDEKPLLYAGISLFTKESDVTGEFSIYSSSVLPSICGDCEKELDELLDRNAPPVELTRILGKGESWVWRTSVDFRLTAEGENKYSRHESLGKIKSRQTKIMASIGYSMFPNNSKIGWKVKKRWKNFGRLYLSETHSLLDSQPFEIDLKSVEVQK